MTIKRTAALMGLLKELNHVTEQFDEVIDCAIKANQDAEISTSLIKLKSLVEEVKGQLAYIDVQNHESKSNDFVVLIEVKRKIDKVLETLVSQQHYIYSSSEPLEYKTAQFYKKDTRSEHLTTSEKYYNALIFATRAILYVIDVIVSMLSALHDKKRYGYVGGDVKTYSEVNETPFARSLTGRSQFLPKPILTIKSGQEELKRASAILQQVTNPTSRYGK